MQLIKNREPKLSEKNQFLFVVCSTPTFDIEPFLVKIYLVEIISLKSSFEMFPPVTIIAVFLPSKR